MDDIKIVKEWYKRACYDFFSEEIKEAQNKIGKDANPAHFSATLKGRFVDVSHFANKTTPLAAPISAIASELGRSILK